MQLAWQERQGRNNEWESGNRDAPLLKKNWHFWILSKKGMRNSIDEKIFNAQDHTQKKSDYDAEAQRKEKNW